MKTRFWKLNQEKNLASSSASGFAIRRRINPQVYCDAPKLLSFLLAGILVFCTSSGASADIFGSIWNGFKSVVSAPVRAVGWLVGQGINSAVDPTLDNTFGRLRETTDHAIDRMDEVSKKRLEEFDRTAKARIDQLDDVMKRRIDQVDTVLDDKLKKMEVIASDILDKEGKILDTKLLRAEEILDKSLDRLQSIETDAFDRVDAALQDQVPFAASQVARTLEWTAIFIIFLVVLVGLTGGQLIKMVYATPGPASVWSKLRTNLKLVPRTLLVVGVPMIFLVAIIQIGYITYYTKADWDRISRVEDAANVLERAGDFRSATTFRKRAFALSGKVQRHYMVLRDNFLADFWQRHFGEDPVELSRRMNQLLTDPAFQAQAEKDDELRAANLYMQSSYVNDPEAPNSRMELAREIEQYKNTFFKGKKATQLPVLGKLVYMAEIRLKLEDTTQEVKSRLDGCLSAINELLSQQPYERYAPALVFRAHLKSHLLELDTYSLVAPPPKPQVDSRVAELQKDADTAFAADPNLARYIRFRSTSLPENLVTLLNMLNEKPANQRNQVKDPSASGKPAIQVADEGLNKFAVDLDERIRPLLGSDALVRPKVELQIFRAIRIGLGEAQLKKQIENARTSKNAGELAGERFKKYALVFGTAQELGKLHLAEAWLKEAQRLTIDSPDAFHNNEANMVKDKLKLVSKSDMPGLMFYLFGDSLHPDK